MVNHLPCIKKRATNMTDPLAIDMTDPLADLLRSFARIYDRSFGEVIPIFQPHYDWFPDLSRKDTCRSYMTRFLSMVIKGTSGASGCYVPCCYRAFPVSAGRYMA
jgi:hypothetical protein